MAVVTDAVGKFGSHAVPDRNAHLASAGVAALLECQCWQPAEPIKSVCI